MEHPSRFSPAVPGVPAAPRNETVSLRAKVWIAGALVAIAAIATAPIASAQYIRPSSVPQSTVKALLESGKDDQKAVLRGRIVSHDGDDDYTFEDETGRIRVEISANLFPAGQPIDDKRQVELTGELDRDRGKVEFDVDKLRPL